MKKEKKSFWAVLKEKFNEHFRGYTLQTFFAAAVTPPLTGDELMREVSLFQQRMLNAAAKLKAEKTVMATVFARELYRLEPKPETLGDLKTWLRNGLKMMDRAAEYSGPAEMQSAKRIHGIIDGACHMIDHLHPVVQIYLSRNHQAGAFSLILYAGATIGTPVADGQLESFLRDGPAPQR